MITHWRSVQRLVFSSYVALQYTGGTRAQASFATYQLWQQLGAEAHKATYLPGGVNRDHSTERAKPNDMIALTLAASQPAAAHLEARERLRATCARAAEGARRALVSINVSQRKYHLINQTISNQG